MDPVLKLNQNKSGLIPPAINEFTPEVFRRELFAYCRKLTQSNWDAEDITQEALLRSLSHIATHKNPKAYLFRIAKNAWIDHCRKQKDEMELIEHVHGKNDRDSSRITEAISLLLKELSPLQCVIFLLRDVWLFSTLEVAQLIGMTEGAVKSALFRARKNVIRLKFGETNIEPVKDREESDAQKVLLNTLVNAFLSEDLEALLVLAQNDVIHPIHALSELWNSEAEHTDMTRVNNNTAYHAIAA